MLIDRERFMRKVHVVAGPMPTPCWIWKGKLKDGYGRFHVTGRTWRAHMLSWLVFKGEEVPRGLVLDHLCRNRACTNPAHLEPVTQRVNILRGANHVAQRAATTHCPAGHVYSDENTYRDNLGRRYCRACRRIAARRRRAA